MAAELERLRMEEKRDTKMRQQIRETRCLFMPVTELLLWKFFLLMYHFTRNVVTKLEQSTAENSEL